MRDILSERKAHLKANEVVHLEIPCYNEISVKNLYDDALADPELQKYLPSKKQVSNKLPERNFFFGVLCNAQLCDPGTLKRLPAGHTGPIMTAKIGDGFFTGDAPRY
jgi:hypothetical protein